MYVRGIVALMVPIHKHDHKRSTQTAILERVVENKDFIDNYKELNSTLQTRYREHFPIFIVICIQKKKTKGQKPEYSIHTVYSDF